MLEPDSGSGTPPSNGLSVAGTLPKDQARMLATLDAVLVQPEAAAFRPRWSRGP